MKDPARPPTSDPPASPPAAAGSASGGADDPIWDPWRSSFLKEAQEDRKAIRYTIVAAVVLHLGLFALNLPVQAAPEEIEKEQTEPYVVQTVKLKPPPPPPEPKEPPPPPPPEEPKEPIPQPKPKPKVDPIPVPDPTPDEPEPVVREPIPTPEPEPVIELPEVSRIEPVEVPMPEIEVAVEIPAPPAPPPPPPAPPAPPALPEGPIRVGGDVTAPVKVHGPPPQYPDPARRANVEGTVVIEAVIDKRGNVTQVKVVKGLPMGLEKVAAEAVKSWKFKPGTLHGKPVDVYYNLTVNFSLQ